MKAVINRTYGSADVLRLVDIEKPVPTDDQIRIKIHAVSINGSDREGLVGRPLYVRFAGPIKPINPILGSDIAGIVESTGENITEFKPGDEVFGELPSYHGGFAEYVCTSGKTLVPKPAGMSFEEAAAIPQAGVIALQGIREKGKVQPGQSVLINGAGGSAGSFAVQLAKMYGAEVTGVDSAEKLDFLRALGADHVIDYTKQDFTKTGEQYDLVLDVIAHRSVFACEQALKPNGTYYVVGGSVAVILQFVFLGPWIGRKQNRKLRVLGVPQNGKDLLAITELCQTGKIVPKIDRVMSLSEVPEAMRYVAEGRAKGKVVIALGDMDNMTQPG